MKSVLLFCVAVILGIIGIILYLKFTTVVKNQVPTEPSKLTTQFSLPNAPSQSLRGTISSLSGSVEWESRIATQASTITSSSQPSVIQQGENLVTDTNGNVTVQFPDSVTTRLFPNSETDFIETLPANLVVAQPSGTAEYTTEGTVPISVRSLSLVVLLKNGDATVSLNSTQTKVIVQVTKGSITAGYEDFQNLSNVVSATSGQKLIFDEGTRTDIVE